MTDAKAGLLNKCLEAFHGTPNWAHGCSEGYVLDQQVRMQLALEAAQPSPPASAEVVEARALEWLREAKVSPGLERALVRQQWKDGIDIDVPTRDLVSLFKTALQAGAAVQVPEDDGMVRLPPEALYYMSATEYWALDPQDAKERTHYLRRKLNFSGLPMDIAPTDKREVLLYCGQWVCGRRSDDAKDPERLSIGYTTDCTWPGMTEPTAWLPLPKGLPIAAAPQKQGA